MGGQWMDSTRDGFEVEKPGETDPIELLEYTSN